MSCCNKEKIASLAHQMWEEAGRPDCDGFDFWVKAESEVCGTPVQVVRHLPPVIEVDWGPVLPASSPGYGTFVEIGDGVRKGLVATVPSFEAVKPPEFVLDNAIRCRAYQLWEDAGRPAGDGVNFWLAAEAEVTNLYNLLKVYG